MNLANPSNTVDLRVLIANTAGVSAETAAAVVAAMHQHGYGVVHAPCAGCRKIHESYPSVQAWHHPLCREVTACAACNKPLGHMAHVVGEVCADCAFGDRE